MITRDGSAPPFASTSRISSGASWRRPGMDQYRRARFPLGDCRRQQGLALVGGQRPGATDLPDDARSYAAALNALDDVADDLPRQILDASLIHVGRMGRFHVEAGPHDDVNTRFPGYPDQRIRVASDSRAGRVHDRAATDVAVFPDFAYRCVQVHQLKVGAVAVVVAPYPSEVLERDGRIRQLLGRGVLGRAIRECEVDVEVLMGRGGAQFRGRDRAQHGLDQTRIPV